MEIEYLGKCLFIEESGKGMLVVGDLHLGFEESLNKSGVFVTREMFSEMILYFNSVFDRLDSKGKKVNEIILLGDVKHGFARPERQEWKDVLELFDYFIGKMEEINGVGKGKVIIVKGNHDNYLANLAGKRDVTVLKSYIVGGIGFCHGNKKVEEIEKEDVRVWVMGHGHPAVRIRDKERKEEKYKCFLVGKYNVKGKGVGNVKKVIIVPSFFDFSEGTDPRESNLCLGWDFDLEKFDVKIVGDDLEVLDFGVLWKLEKLK